MRRLIMTIGILAALAVPAMAGGISADIAMSVTRESDASTDAVNDFSTHTAIYLNITDALRVGGQGTMSSLGDISEGGMIAMWKIPVELKLGTGWMGFEVIGWTEDTGESFDFARGAAGINILYDPNPETTTLGFLSIMADGYKEMETVTTFDKSLTPTTQEIESKGTDLTIRLGLRFSIE